MKKSIWLSILILFISHLSAEVNAGDKAVLAKLCPQITDNANQRLDWNAFCNDPENISPINLMGVSFTLSNDQEYYVDNLSLDSIISGEIPSEIGQLSKVTSLRISNNHLSGPIPKEIGQLSNLTTLVLFSNNLSGSIPAEIGKLSNLKTLNLAYNNLTGEIPSSVWQLTKVESLDLRRNNLEGTVPSLFLDNSLLHLRLGQKEKGLDCNRIFPSIITTSPNITDLRLDNCKLSGNIPAEIKQLRQLVSLSLSRNQLTGEIPPELGEQQFFWLNLSHNKLNGSIPKELGNWSYLMALLLNDNELSGQIPVELGQMSSLEGLALNNNELSGRIPAELGKLSRLNELYISNNKLSGTIPAELANLNLSFLWLENNQILGTIPKFKYKLCQLWLHGNLFTNAQINDSKTKNLISVHDYMPGMPCSHKYESTLHTNLRFADSFEAKP